MSRGPRPTRTSTPGAAAPRLRVVSLVPSETESVVVMAGIERLIGRTDFCLEPAGQIEGIPSVGGTKRFDVERVLALEPDLILANQEENGERDVKALIAAGAPVHLSFPRSLEDSCTYLHELNALLGRDRSDVLEGAERAVRDAAPPAWRARTPRVAVPIWRDPFMSFDEHTFASAMLEAAGADNVFAGRPRRYPLAADLDAARLEKPTTKDTRYPRFAIEELLARAPDVVLLPDEPFAFDERHRDELRALLGHDRVVLMSGKDLFWYGVRAAGAVSRLRALLASLEPG